MKPLSLSNRLKLQNFSVYLQKLQDLGLMLEDRYFYVFIKPKEQEYHIFSKREVLLISSKLTSGQYHRSLKNSQPLSETDTRHNLKQTQDTQPHLKEKKISRLMAKLADFS